jgi:transcriptional regulator with XRE-family HTH domain
MKESVNKLDKKDQNVHDRADSSGGLAVFLANRRKSLSLTQEDLSDMAGVSLRLVHGKESVRLENLIKILSSLGVHLKIAEGAKTHVTIDHSLATLTRRKNG